jgi:hypothetical protein
MQTHTHTHATLARTYNILRIVILYQIIQHLTGNLYFYTRKIDCSICLLILFIIIVKILYLYMLNTK